MKIVAANKKAEYDYYISQKNLGKILAWSKKLDEGYLGFDRGYRAKIHNTIATLRLNEAVKNAKTNVAKAEKQYMALSQNRYASPEIKAQALLALADINVKKFNFTQTNKWVQQSFQTLPESEIIKYSSQLYAIAEQFAIHQKFDESLM